jgi:hypothetical protein
MLRGDKAAVLPLLPFMARQGKNPFFQRFPI